MKSSLPCCLLAALWIAACTRPDTDLFTASGVSSTPMHGGGSDAFAKNGGSGPHGGSAGAPASSGGTETSSAGTGGGTVQPGGGTATSTTAGAPGTPDPSGMAGASDAAGGGGAPPASDPVCGNGIIEAGEQCDDAGHVGQDGCDACQVVCSQHGPGTLESADYHCYNGYDAAPFEGAQQDCVKRGGHLATISSADENKIARTFVNDGKWIGGFEDVPLMSPGTGDYGWITGEPFTYTNWQQGEPNRLEYRCNGGDFNARCYEHCITILGDGTWADRHCDVADGYVCEWEPPSGAL